MKRTFYLLFGLLVMTLGCQTNLKLTDQQKDSILKDVKQTSQQFWNVYSQTYNAGSLEMIMSFIDEKSDQNWQSDPALVVFNTNIFKTRSDLENIWKEMLKNRSSTNVGRLDNYFTVLSKEQVLEVNEGDYTLTGKDGQTFGPYRMVNSVIWVNRNGAWKMLHFHESWASQKE